MPAFRVLRKKNTRAVHAHSTCTAGKTLELYKVQPAPSARGRQVPNRLDPFLLLPRCICLSPRLPERLAPSSPSCSSSTRTQKTWPPPRTHPVSRNTLNVREAPWPRERPPPPPPPPPPWHPTGTEKPSSRSPACDPIRRRGGCRRRRNSSFHGKSASSYLPPPPPSPAAAAASEPSSPLGAFLFRQLLPRPTAVFLERDQPASLDSSRFILSRLSSPASTRTPGSGCRWESSSPGRSPASCAFPGRPVLVCVTVWYERVRLTCWADRVPLGRRLGGGGGQPVLTTRGVGLCSEKEFWAPVRYAYPLAGRIRSLTPPTGTKGAP